MRYTTWTFLLLLGIPSLPDRALAQAWVGDPNSLSVSVGYNFGFANSIVETQGLSLDGIRTFQHTILFGAEYVTPLPGLALTASLPLIGIQYRGTDLPESDIIRPHGAYDDGSTHVVSQDFRADLRYSIQAIEEFIALAVSVGGSFPTQDYETQGYASVGRGLIQGHFGLALGRTLTPILPALYFHASYTFSLSQAFKTDFEDTNSISQHYSTISGQIGYFIIDGLQVNVATDIRIAHGGINFLDWDTLTQVQRDFHDAIIRENAYLVGGGIAYDIIEELNVALLGRAFVGGTNTRNSSFVGLTVSYQIF